MNFTFFFFNDTATTEIYTLSLHDALPISVKLTVFCDDRFGMLKQITAVISDSKTNIRNIEARTNNGQANIDIVLDIADLKHLENIVTGVRKIPGVHDVQRLQKV